MDELEQATTLYVSGRVIFAEDSDTGRSKCPANGSSCVSIDHIVLMRGRKNERHLSEYPRSCAKKLLPNDAEELLVAAT